MAPTEDLRDVGMAIIILRSLPVPRWNQAELSRQSGIEKSLISNYEAGKTRPGRSTRRRLAETVGGDLAFFEQLVAQSRSLRLACERACLLGAAGAPAPDEAAASPAERIAEAVLESLGPFLLQLPADGGVPGPRAEDRAWADERWSRMEPLPAESQSLLVEALKGDERTWALADRLCRASAAVRSADVDEALRLVRLALRLAEAVPGPESWRLRLRGWCEPFLAKALQTKGDRAAAEGTFARAEELWRRGTGGDPRRLLGEDRRPGVQRRQLM